MHGVCSRMKPPTHSRESTECCQLNVRDKLQQDCQQQVNNNPVHCIIVRMASASPELLVLQSHTSQVHCSAVTALNAPTAVSILRIPVGHTNGGSWPHDGCSERVCHVSTAEF